MKRQVVVPARAGATDTPPPSVAGVLEIKQARQLSAQIVSAPRNRLVCRFWTEKLLLGVDVMQLYALLWQLSQPWPWPSRWLRWTRWVNAFNVDVFSFGATGAAMGSTSQPFSPWGEMRHYWLYALVFGATPALFCLLLWLFVKKWEMHGRVDFLSRRIAWENVLVHALYVLYVPVGLAVLRLVHCDERGRVSVDPTTLASCWSTPHSLAVAGITCCLGGVYLVGFPLWLRKRIGSVVFTDDVDEHEWFLQGKELEYLLATSDAYTELYMPIYASFCVHASYAPVEFCAVKLTLLLSFSLLRSKALQSLQGDLFFIVFLVLALRQTWLPKYRVESTNQLAKLMLWLLVANGAIGSGDVDSVALLCANGVRSALTVATSVTSSLSFVNGILLVIVLLSLGSSLSHWRRRKELLPDPRGGLLAPNACWPTHPLIKDIVDGSSGLDDWVLLIKEARTLSLRTATAPSMLKPFPELGAALQRLEESWHAARAVDHLLSAQLHQELLLLADLYVDALATSPFKDMVEPTVHASDFVVFAERLKRRDDQQRLFSVDQRRVMSKLRVESTWSRKDQQVQDGSESVTNISIAGNGTISAR